MDELGAVPVYIYILDISNPSLSLHSPPHTARTAAVYTPMDGISATCHIIYYFECCPDHNLSNYSACSDMQYADTSA